MHEYIDFTVRDDADSESKRVAEVCRMLVNAIIATKNDIGDREAFVTVYLGYDELYCLTRLDRQVRQSVLGFDPIDGVILGCNFIEVKRNSYIAIAVVDTPIKAPATAQ